MDNSEAYGGRTAANLFDVVGLQFLKKIHTPGTIWCLSLNAQTPKPDEKRRREEILLLASGTYVLLPQPHMWAVIRDWLGIFLIGPHSVDKASFGERRKSILASYML